MLPFGEEGRLRVQRHRRMRRDKGFETVECYTNLSGLEIPEGCAVLLECVSNLTANEMYQEEGAGRKNLPGSYGRDPEPEKTGGDLCGSDQ